MQIPIVSGIYTDQGPDLRSSYPVNMVPVPKVQGISSGYLRPGDGLVEQATGPGVDRGGILWNGVLYRVMGSKLVSISDAGVITILGDVGGTTELVVFDYSFDRLAVCSVGNFFYWSPTLGLVQVTDPDLGTVLDFAWVDGYFMTTDGTYLVVTELSDPLQVNPIKYGSSDADPDPIVAILKLRNEIYAINRNTIEVFDNAGGSLFPFERIEGAQIQKGAVGTQACCVYQETIAFLGSGRNAAPAIYIGANAMATKLSTQEVDEILSTYTDAQLAQVKLEARNLKAQQLLYVHLPDRTLVYDAASSQALQQQVWFVMTSSIVDFAQYRARNFVWAYDKWMVGDPTSTKIGYCVDTIATHWGETVRWEFGTTIVYNEGKGALFHQLELVALTGRVALGTNPWISTSYSYDGQAWSQDRAIQIGSTGQTQKRLVWFQQGNMRHWRVQRFRGDSQAHLSFVRLEAQIEPLNY